MLAEQTELKGGNAHLHVESADSFAFSQLQEGSEALLFVLRLEAKLVQNALRCADQHLPRRRVGGAGGPGVPCDGGGRAAAQLGDGARLARRGVHVERFAAARPAAACLAQHHQRVARRGVQEQRVHGAHRAGLTQLNLCAKASGSLSALGLATLRPLPAAPRAPPAAATHPWRRPLRSQSG